MSVHVHEHVLFTFFTFLYLVFKSQKVFFLKFCLM